MSKCNVASVVNIFAAQEQHLPGLLQHIEDVTSEEDMAPQKVAYIDAYKLWARMRVSTYLV